MEAFSEEGSAGCSQETWERTEREKAKTRKEGLAAERPAG